MKLTEEMRRLALSEGPYEEWRLPQREEEASIQEAERLLAKDQQTLGHALGALRGRELEEAKTALTRLQGVVNAALEALNRN